MKDTINYLKNIREVTYSQGGVDCLTKAIEACEKQVAVKTIKDIRPCGTIQRECPTCNHEAVREWGHDHCWNCGQKIDWED